MLLELEKMDVLGIIDFSVWWCKFSLGLNEYCKDDVLNSYWEKLGTGSDELPVSGQVNWFDFSVPEICFTVVVIIIFVMIRNTMETLFPRVSKVFHQTLIFSLFISLLGLFYSVFLK